MNFMKIIVPKFSYDIMMYVLRREVNGNKKQSFMKGVMVIMFSQILIKLLGFVYRIVLTNFPQFADEGNSYYGSGYTVYTLILAIATMGIPNTMSKLISEKWQ